ncbi:MAG: multicopper oxidase family protein [Myxococcota bacterium]|nr:multicopper oxidase family protein [Myxococcota bacterium]
MSSHVARRLVATALAALVVACGPPPPDHAQPAGWDDEVRLARAVDLDPDPHTIEIDLVAREAELSIVPQGPTRLWTYDGTLPGPMIEARVGDRLIVHFRNELPEETTIHWHGLRVPNEMDGAPGHTQPAIPPGGTFEYEFVLPDEGLYWFHPHQRSAVQVAAGLYGTIVVRADDEPEMDELVVVLSDVALKEDNGSLLAPTAGGALATLFGREGNYALINGRVDAAIRARNGVPLRLRFVNAAISRYFQLAVAGHSFTIIGGDRGLLPEPRTVSRLLVLPGQRVDAILVPRGVQGRPLSLRWVPYDRGYGSTEFRDEVDLLRIELVGAAPVAALPMPELPERTVPPLSTLGATRFDVELTQATVDGELRMGIDGVPSWESTPVYAHLGETQIWTFRNTMDWAHPMHLHGYFFQALDRDGNVIPEWLDTIDVPVEGEASFVVHYDERPGMWMFHCHILDHADAGMMGMIDVGGDDGGHVIPH